MKKAKIIFNSNPSGRVAHKRGAWEEKEGVGMRDTGKRKSTFVGSRGNSASMKWQSNKVPFASTGVNRYRNEHWTGGKIWNLDVFVFLKRRNALNNIYSRNNGASRDYLIIKRDLYNQEGGQVRLEAVTLTEYNGAQNHCWDQLAGSEKHLWTGRNHSCSPLVLVRDIICFYQCCITVWVIKESTW